ncbi:MAG: DUF4333 domain-containing protein [Cyanobacteria bacterium J06626_14]
MIETETLIGRVKSLTRQSSRLRSKSSQWFYKVAGGGLLLISGCSAQLNTEAIALSIQTELDEQGDIVVEKVICPRDVEPIVGQSFYCWGKLSDDEFFPIEVEQVAEVGETGERQAVDWGISTSRTMLNLAQLELEFQDTLSEDVETEIAQDLGAPIQIDCGATYRENTPGETFNCQIDSGIVIDNRRLDAVKVTIDSQGNLNWQAVRNLITPEELQAAEEEGLVFESIPPETDETAVSGTGAESTGADNTGQLDDSPTDEQQAALPLNID